jgi:hypothetical protein
MFQRSSAISTLLSAKADPNTRERPECDCEPASDTALPAEIGALRNRL